MHSAAVCLLGTADALKKNSVYSRSSCRCGCRYRWTFRDGFSITKSFISTLPLRFPWKQAWQLHTCECLGVRMACLLTLWEYVCEREIAYGSGSMCTSVSLSKYIYVCDYILYMAACAFSAMLSCMLLCCIFEHVLTLYLCVCVTVFGWLLLHLHVCMH